MKERHDINFHSCFHAKCEEKGNAGSFKSNFLLTNTKFHEAHSFY